MGHDATRAVENGDNHSEGADGYDTEALLTYLEMKDKGTPVE